MTRYSRVKNSIWHSRTFRSLPEDAQFLWLYLLTCPHGNLIGLFVLKPEYAKGDLNWSSKKYNRALKKLQEIEGANVPKMQSGGHERGSNVPETENGGQVLAKNGGLVDYDPTSNVIFLRNFLEHNPLKNPNQVKAAINKIKELPKTPLLEEFEQFIKQLGEQLYKPLHEQLCKLLGKPVAVAVAEDLVTNQCPETRYGPEGQLEPRGDIDDRKSDQKQPKSHPPPQLHDQDIKSKVWEIQAVLELPDEDEKGLEYLIRNYWNNINPAIAAVKDRNYEARQGRAEPLKNVMAYFRTCVTKEIPENDT